MKSTDVQAHDPAEMKMGAPLPVPDNFPVIHVAVELEDGEKVVSHIIPDLMSCIQLELQQPGANARYRNLLVALLSFQACTPKVAK